ncbi:hypothetical protein Amet_2402 [Alkaliphilus metalliredigens QYMF]|uniref:Uncharacterized protein n=1 Tax=Alkaliphilus metalliredigens (strain QYMF) TaxID=293826 RepID=A6TQT8_ALKMQ|nr:hypothetical protein [Alkaliphilus metalliredigens]ABR48556.1 hypothetical protein Amet_2402 [Alkaliphilus metalliredigens QYMF]
MQKKSEVESGKKDMLGHQMKDFIDGVLERAEEDRKLDHINISISNHNGALQMDYTFRDRKKAY